MKSFSHHEETQITEYQQPSFQLQNAEIELKYIYEHLSFMAQMVPACFYWMDINGRFIGTNQYGIKAVGADCEKDLIGKTVYELYKDKDIADKLQRDIDEVIRTGQTSRLEDKIIDIRTRKYRYFSATRAPLRDSRGKIIGVIGNSIEITAEKEAERLRFEQQEKFKKSVGQMIHDIQSPLTSLLAIAQNTTEIPEQERIILRAATTSIADITNNLLRKYNNVEVEEELRQSVLASATLYSILSEKRYQFKDLPIEFNTNFATNASFSFIKVEPSNFKRAISNIINNAVDALEGSKGKITVGLNTDNEWVNISIEDTGNGMPEEVLEKINNKIAVTRGKPNGNGIGLTQVWDTLTRNYGKHVIYSKVGYGTKIILKFPKVPSPHWIADEIKVTKDSLVIVVDDDLSIHGAWDSRFRQIKEQFPYIELKHFSSGTEAIEFINSLPQKKKKSISLLTDYELLKQEINGLEVIKQTGIKRSILVTSHYANPEVRELTAQAKVKILPKELAFDVSIKVDKKVRARSKKVDMVWVDDETIFVNSLIAKYYNNLTIDTYSNPNEFLENFKQYPLNTKIILDTYYYSEFDTYDIDGFALAKYLHENGYINLYLLAGENISQDRIPPYLTLVLKSDLDKVKLIHKL